VVPDMPANNPLDQTFAPLLNQSPVQTACSVIAQHGGYGYLVGGAVRDWLWRQHISDDVDIAVTQVSAVTVAKGLAEALNGRYVLLDPDNGIHRVVLLETDSSSPVKTLDIADALGNDIACDLARRDLTINAMAVDLQTGLLKDPFEGEADLTHRRIAMVSEANLVDDPLRLLRVFRFMAALGAATIDEQTLAAVTQHRQLLTKPAGERLSVEWLKLLSAPESFETVQTMGQSGVLEVLFPEFNPMRDIPANGHHHLGLFDHTLELVRQAERWFPTLPDNTKTWLNQPFYATISRLTLVKFACLLHDIGKPATLDRREDGRLTFYGHDKVSADLTQAIAQRFKLSKKVSEYLQKLCRWHLYPCHFGQTSPRKSVLRFFRRIDADVPDLILLALADRHSTLGPEITDDILQTAHQNHLWLLNEYYAEQAVLRLPPLLSGGEVMTVLGLSPGPQVGVVLKALQEAQQLGELTTSEEATCWIQTWYGHLLAPSS